MWNLGFLADPRVIDARVMTEKLDIEPEANVGIEIERRRHAAVKHHTYPLPSPIPCWIETKPAGE